MKGLLRAAVVTAAAVAAAVAATGAQEASLADVLARAGQYVTGYERRFAVLVAEERYVQEIHKPVMAPIDRGNLSRNNPGGGSFGGGGGVSQRRTLVSDYLLVQLEMGAGWMPFRDVFSVDGKPVRDREDRLTDLFIKPHTDAAFDQAARIVADSTRYNIGAVTRTVNIPTLALMFLHPDLRPRFEFSPHGTEVVEGRTAWVLEYRETRRPTLVRTSNGRDLAMTGRLWVDPATGVILRTNLTAADPLVRATVTVSFRNDEKLDLWVPALMEEHYKASNDVNDIHGTATYSNYRQFQVTTDEATRKPPGGALRR
ncbi:MAG: hypothetical protein ACLGHP_02690 [Vicinamibacteria bacterium]